MLTYADVFWRMLGGEGGVEEVAAEKGVTYADVC